MDSMNKRMQDRLANRPEVFQLIRFEQPLRQTLLDALGISSLNLDAFHFSEVFEVRPNLHAAAIDQVKRSVMEGTHNWQATLTITGSTPLRIFLVEIFGMIKNSV